MGFQSTYLLDMGFRYNYRFPHGPTIDALDLPIFRPTINVIPLPLDSPNSLRMLPKIINRSLFKIIIKNKSTLIISQSYLILSWTEMHSIYFLATLLYYILTIEWIFELVMYRHVIEEELLITGCTDEVVMRPIQEIRVVVVCPCRHFESADWLGRSHHFVRYNLVLLLMRSLLYCILSYPFAFE